MKTKLSRFKGVTMFRDRHGKLRFRARAAGKPAMYLPGDFGSDEFVAAYHRWCNEKYEQAPTGWVYFIAAVGTGLVKIGYSKKPDSRLKTLSQQSAIEYQMITAIPGSMQDETAHHKRFNHLRQNGEWFKYTEEVYQYVKALAELHGATPWRRHSKPGADVPLYEDTGFLE